MTTPNSAQQGHLYKGYGQLPYPFNESRDMAFSADLRMLETLYECSSVRDRVLAHKHKGREDEIRWSFRYDADWIRTLSRYRFPGLWLVSYIPNSKSAARAIRSQLRFPIRLSFLNT